MKLDDLITFIVEEAQHHAINDKCTKTAESALAAHSKKSRGRKEHCDKGKEKSESNEMCNNCKRLGHDKANRWSKGRGKEGQGHKGHNSKKEEKKTETVGIADTNTNAEEMFVFTCTSNYTNVAEALKIPKSQLGACIDIRASHHYSPHHDKFENYCPITGCTITTADG